MKITESQLRKIIRQELKDRKLTPARRQVLESQDQLLDSLTPGSVAKKILDRLSHAETPYDPVDADVHLDVLKSAMSPAAYEELSDLMADYTDMRWGTARFVFAGDYDAELDAAYDKLVAILQGLAK